MQREVGNFALTTTIDLSSSSLLIRIIIDLTAIHILTSTLPTEIIVVLLLTHHRWHNALVHRWTPLKDGSRRRR